jgi:hypothetical protein
LEARPVIGYNGPLVYFTSLSEWDALKWDSDEIFANPPTGRLPLRSQGSAPWPLYTLNEFFPVFGITVERTGWEEGSWTGYAVQNVYLERGDAGWYPDSPTLDGGPLSLVLLTLMRGEPLQGNPLFPILDQPRVDLPTILVHPYTGEVTSGTDIHGVTWDTISAGAVEWIHPPVS